MEKLTSIKQFYIFVYILYLETKNVTYAFVVHLYITCFSNFISKNNAKLHFIIIIILER